MNLSKTCPWGAWRRHGDLDLSKKQLETKAEDFVVVQWLKPSEDYIMIFLLTKRSIVQENGVRRAHEVLTR